MKNYTELIKALRCELHYTSCPVSDCKYICHDTFCDTYRLMTDAADAIEALQADIKRLKEANDELREKQTYIDHYGDRWMTSAKDVPTSAYEHGYADGRDEAEAQLPKRGEIVRRGECMHRKDSIQCPLCSEGVETADDWFCADGERKVQDA